MGASRKALAIEEDTIGINDGAWWSNTSDLLGSIPGPLSVTTRHDGGERYDGGMLEVDGYVYKGRRNVVFADGHVDFVSRLDLGKMVDPRLP